MEFRDAGKTYGKCEPVSPSEKYYTKLDIDLLKFPELAKDIGEECTVVIKGIITAKTLTETDKCQVLEVKSIGVGAPEKSEAATFINEADKALSNLKSKTQRY